MPNTTPLYVVGQVVAFNIYGYTTYAQIEARDAQVEPASTGLDEWIYIFADNHMMPESRLRGLTALEASGT